MNYGAVICDLDGTLLDTLDDLADSMNVVLERRGFPVHPPASYKLFVGEGIRNLVIKSLPEQVRDEATIDSAVRDMSGEYDRRWACKTHPYDGISEMFDELARRNLPVAVLSNKPDRFVKMAVARFLSRWNFAAVFGERAGVPRKPDPAGALEAAGHVRVPPANCLYLGDSRVDMQTATAAGMFPVGVLWGFRSREELVASGAKALLEHPRQLQTLIGG